MAITIKNLMEDIVSQKLEKMVDKLGVCTCDICKTDILCYTLNRLHPKYVATNNGELLSKIDSLSNTLDIATITELTNAAMIVKNHPRHN